MSVSTVGGHLDGFAKTQREDGWWIGPLLTVLGLGAFTVYVTTRAFMGDHYWAEPYLSPLYSPLVFANVEYWAGAPVEHAWFEGWPSWFPSFLPASPAFFILLFPGAFRATCYYYRKSYYRSFFGMPPGCAVCPIGHNYGGETKLFLFQNLHRYALYGALAFVVILSYDVYLACWKNDQFGVGVGTLVLLMNVILIAGYTFGCHSFRHLIGGRLNWFTRKGSKKGSFKLWQKVTYLNERHMLFAWLSLFWVGFTDFYVYAVSRGWITDLNTWGGE